MARSIDALILRPVFAFLPLYVAEQRGALGIRHAGDQRAADRGGGDRQARALRQAQHRAVLGARKLQVDQVEPVASAERDDGAGVVRHLLHVGAGELADADVGERRIAE